MLRDEGRNEKNKAEAGLSPNPKNPKVGAGGNSGGSSGGGAGTRAVPPLPGGGGTGGPEWRSELLAMEERMVTRIADMFKSEVAETKAMAKQAQETAEIMKGRMSEMEKGFAELRAKVESTKVDIQPPGKVKKLVSQMLKEEGEKQQIPPWGWWNSGAANRANSGGATGRNDRDPALRNRTAVVTGFTDFTHEKDIHSTVEKLYGEIKALEKKYTNYRRTNCCYLQFQTGDDKLAFLKEMRGPKTHGDLKIYVNADKTPEERKKDKSVNKLKRVLLAHEKTVPGFQQEGHEHYLDVIRGPGIVLIGRKPVGKWDRFAGEFKVQVKAIDSLQLGFQGAHIKDLWVAEMEKKRKVDEE